MVQTPRNLDDEQRELLRRIAELRDETRPEVSVDRAHKGMFDRIKDAFTG